MVNGLQPIERLIMGIWGPVKTAKSTLALTLPKPLVHIDLDQSVDRALVRFQDCTIQRVPYGVPLSQVQLNFDITTKPYQLPVKWGEKVSGMVDLWALLWADLQVICESNEIASLVIDTGTILRHINVQMYLEKAQQVNNTRTSLSPIEYGKPNAEMRAFLGAPRTYGKNLAIVHHVGGIYEEHMIPDGRGNIKKESIKVGDTWDGFTATDQFVDIMLRTNKIVLDGNVPKPEAIVEICGYTLAMEGKTIEDASFDKILTMINSLRAMGQ